jgi:ABC-type transporter Mla MlaB component
MSTPVHSVGLPSQLTAATLASVQQTFREINLLQPPATIKLDGSAVERIDIAGLQLLAAFIKRYESNHQGHVTWRRTSEVLVKAAAISGVLSDLHLPSLH